MSELLNHNGGAGPLIVRDRILCTPGTGENDGVVVDTGWSSLRVISPTHDVIATVLDTATGAPSHPLTIPSQLVEHSVHDEHLSAGQIVHLRCASGFTIEPGEGS
jgi:hypothetical protein